MALELVMASSLEAPRLFDDARLTSTGPPRAEACKYGCDVLNMTARVREYRTFHGRWPFARLLPFLRPGFHHMKRTL